MAQVLCATANRHPASTRRRRLLIGAATTPVLWATAGDACAAGHAQALLIGNTSYNPTGEDIAPARKCIRELDLRLKQLGYDVVALHDPPIAQVRGELESLQRAVTTDPTTTTVFYFVGHGFQSNSENFVLPAGGNLNDAPEQLAKQCISLEREVFSRLKRPLGPVASVIMIDACRTPDRPKLAIEGYNQTIPPEGCHVAFSTGPGKRAFAPNDPNRFTLFTEALVAELEGSQPTTSIYLTLERVRAKVSKQVNSIETIVRIFGPNAQEPELASNVRGDPTWIAGADPLQTASSPGSPSEAVNGGSVKAELEAIRALNSPQDAAARLKQLLERMPPDDQADVARLRLKDLEVVLDAARMARLDPDISDFVAGRAPAVVEDARRALRGDKYAALRVAETLPRPSNNELIERTEYGKWMIFSAYLGNGIAAWRLSEHFKNIDRRDAEASRYLNLARANHYTAPRQLGAGR